MICFFPLSVFLAPYWQETGASSSEEGREETTLQCVHSETKDVGVGKRKTLAPLFRNLWCSKEANMDTLGEDFFSSLYLTTLMPSLDLTRCPLAA